jgi:hypothetical protein
VVSLNILGARLATQITNVGSIDNGIFGHESAGFLAFNHLTVRALGEVAFYHELTTGFGARAVISVDRANLHLQESITSEFSDGSGSLQVAAKLLHFMGLLQLYWTTTLKSTLPEEVLVVLRCSKSLANLVLAAGPRCYETSSD